MRLILPGILLLGATLLGSTGEAATKDYQVDFGPWVGSGSMSGGAKVTSTSGYSLAVARGFKVTDGGLTIGPRVEFSNGFLSAHSGADNGHGLTSTYDNRIFAGGVTISHPLGNAGTFAQGLYLNAMAGKAYSKLTVDDSADRTYLQNLYGNINGNYFAGELGAWIPIKGNFGVNLAFLASSYAADQAGRTGTYDGNKLNPDGSLALTTGAYGKGGGTLPDRVTLRTYAAKVGVALGF